MASEATDPRAALEEERAQLQAQLAEHGGGVEHDDNFADLGQVAAEQSENRTLVGQLEETLTEVERALAKLDEGAYGLCESCAKPIGEARLEAMPATRYCIDCAS
jgi:DnaK suppressor protein